MTDEEIGCWLDDEIVNVFLLWHFFVIVVATLAELGQKKRKIHPRHQLSHELNW